MFMKPTPFFLSSLALGFALHAGDSKAIMRIDLISLDDNSPVQIRLYGSLEIAKLGTGASSNYNSGLAGNLPGIYPTADTLRINAPTTTSPGGTIAGSSYFFNNPRNQNPFTGAAANTFAASSTTTSSGPFFAFAFGSTANAGAPAGKVWISSSYVSNSFVDYTLNFATLSLTDIGLTLGSSPIVYTLGTSPNQEQVIIQSLPVPGPLPFAGAFAAFGFARRLRARTRLENA